MDVQFCHFWIYLIYLLYRQPPGPFVFGVKYLVPRDDLTFAVQRVSLDRPHHLRYQKVVGVFIYKVMHGAVV